MYLLTKKKLVTLLMAGMVTFLMFMVTRYEPLSGQSRKPDKWGAVFTGQWVGKQNGGDGGGSNGGIPNMHYITTDGRFIPPRRIVHLDLKGAPPRISYIQQLLPLIAKAGATDLLVEYEDMFPYWGPIKNISAANSYTRKDVETLLSSAKEHNIAVIPLVQTFGHLEMVLKLEEFQDLREMPAYPQSMCPSNKLAVNLVISMIEQVLELHPDSTHIHIGCDEVYQLGLCSRCQDTLTQINIKNPAFYHDTRYLFLHHVKRIGEEVVKRGLVPIIWDDMLRNLPRNLIKESGIGDLVEPMVWVYVEDIYRFVDTVTWRNYGQLFKGVWTASAFKGAFGERLYAVNMFRHYENQLAWLETMLRESTGDEFPITFRGITLTGWSRYDHFAVLCELLPVAVPSLILSLSIVSAGKADIHTLRKVNEILQCSPQKNLMLADELRKIPNQWDLYRCSYPGVKAFTLISNYHNHRMEVDQFYNKIKDQDGWMSDWHLSHRYSSPWRVEEAMKSSSYLPGVVRDLEKQTRKTMLLYFDEYTVEEWIEQNILPLHNKLSELSNMEEVLVAQRHWPRRPVGSEST